MDLKDRLRSLLNSSWIVIEFITKIMTPEQIKWTALALAFGVFLILIPFHSKTFLECVGFVILCMLIGYFAGTVYGVLIKKK